MHLYLIIVIAVVQCRHVCGQGPQIPPQQLPPQGVGPQQPPFPQQPGPNFPPPPQGPNFGVFGPNQPFFPGFMFPYQAAEPTYMIVASKMVRPGSVYRVVVNLLKSERPIKVRASVSRNGVEVVSSKEVMEVGVPQHMLMKVPDTSIPGAYKLRVEGSVNGMFGGIVFMNETELEFSSRFLTILVQTSRPVYNRLQTVRFRIIMLTTDLRPYTDPVEVSILDPRGYIMRKWFSAYSNVGAVTLQFALPSDPVQGFWTIRVLAQSQVEEKKVLVEKYWAPRFEVDVKLPTFFLDTQEFIHGTIQANYTYLYSPVVGNATLRLSLVPSKYSYTTTITSNYLLETFVPWFNGSYDFYFPMENLMNRLPQLDGATIKVEATVVDKHMEIENSGFASARITNSSISLRFLGSTAKIFKPGMPFQAYMAISYHDLVPLPIEKLQNSRIEIRPMITLNSGIRSPIPISEEQVSEAGIIHVELDVPQDAIRIDIRANYQDFEGDRVSAQMTAVAFYSQERRYIQIQTSTTEPKIGEYVIFHVHTNFNMQLFHYLILSKGIIVASGSEKMETVMQSIKTFGIPVSAEMAPSCRIVIYHTTKDGEILSDSLIVPIDAISRHEISFELNPSKDKVGETVELRVSGDSGAFFGVSVMDADTFSLQAGNELSPASVSEVMHTFETDFNRLNKVSWTSREGKPDRTAYFTTSNYGVDTNRTFDLAGLVVFTDANITVLQDLCLIDMGLLSCLDGTCYRRDQRCNGRMECPNGFDEADCQDDQQDNIQNFRLFRKNHMDRFYDPDYGDWAWINFNLAPEGTEMFPIGPVPRRPAKWVLNAISMSKEFGLGIIQVPYEFEGARPFFITSEMPSVCTRGEQVGVRVDVFNLQPFETYVLLVLADSENYKFVHVESLGYVTSYMARTSFGEHHHLIWVHAHSSFTVHIPIVATHVGDFNVTIEAFTHVGKDRVMRHLKVEPDGMSQFLHTSMLIDLKNQPIMTKFLDVNVTETPIVPYEKWRRYIYESPRAHVSVCGDVVGPAFPHMPVTAEILLRRPDRSAEMQVFNFAANLWTLHYLRLTDQLKLPQAKEAFKHLNVFYAWVMSYMNPTGSFSMWKDFEPSVWLTQFAARSFQQARFADWEFYLYIDQKVIAKAVDWILQFQAPDGSFYETTTLPLDRKMDPRSKQTFGGADNYRFTNVSLTAQVLITLTEIDDLPGELRTRASNAKLKAVLYLERLLSNMKDPYELAVTTYALTRSSSVDAEVGFNALDLIKREQEGKVYWSPEVAPLTSIVMENQRPFIQARLPQKYDAISVEATAYALLVYVRREGLAQEQIVRWLNTMRNTDSGFISTQDTIVAMQALTEYTFRARLREITDMRISIESSATPNDDQMFTIDGSNLYKLQTMKIPNVWGHVQVIGRGAGLGILQLDVQYNIDSEHLMIQPPVRSFDLKITANYRGKNSSLINVRSCQRWIYTEESPASGVAVVEMEVPTGYYQYQPVLDEIVRRKTVRQLRRIKIQERKITIYFNFLDTRHTCVDFTLQRWYPVANMTQYMKARVFDYYAPERYNETIFEAYNLYVLNICEVCGSFQCPYCPYFSAADLTRGSLLLTILCIVLVWRYRTF